MERWLEKKPPGPRQRGTGGVDGERQVRSIELGYVPFPKQQEFHASPAKYRLFGGAAGPGKSKALLMEAILQAHEHAGANTLLLRRTFPELEQSLLLYFRRDVPRELYRSYNEAKHVVTWWNDSTTRFGYCAREAAREAEAALLALESAARAGQAGGKDKRSDGDDDFAGEAGTQTPDSSARGPIHRVEIEATELVPSHTGRAGHGYVARVHRSVAVAPQGATESAASSLFSPRGSAPAGGGGAPRSYGGTTSVAVRPETHVFSNHGDLLNFLDDQLSRDASAQ